jgi:hypothetical protein
MLKEQHAVMSELGYVIPYWPTSTSLEILAPSSYGRSNDIEQYRSEIGYDIFPRHGLTRIEERIAFTMAKCGFTNDKLKQMINRIQTQINVVSVIEPASLEKQIAQETQSHSAS